MERSRIQVTKDKILADMAHRKEVRQSREGFYMWRQEQKERKLIQKDAVGPFADRDDHLKVVRERTRQDQGRTQPRRSRSSGSGGDGGLSTEVLSVMQYEAPPDDVVPTPQVSCEN